MEVGGGYFRFLSVGNCVAEVFGWKPPPPSPSFTVFSTTVFDLLQQGRALVERREDAFFCHFI